MTDEFDGAGDVGREDLITAVESSDAHSDLKAYVRKADDRGGTPILNSMKLLVSVHGVEDGIDRFAELGTQIETTLYESGAMATLDRHGNVDQTNTEILEEIVRDT